MTRTMTRTWQQNSDAINGLWPHCQWTDEEIDLWRSDLSGLDQDVLFEAVREVKRSRDTLYPQLAWVHAAYRTLITAKRSAERSAVVSVPAFTGDRLEIDQDESRRLAKEIADEIAEASVDDIDGILAKIHAHIDRIDAAVAARLAWRAGAMRRNLTTVDGPVSLPLVSVGADDEFENRRATTLRLLREAGS